MSVLRPAEPAETAEPGGASWAGGLDPLPARAARAAEVAAAHADAFDAAAAFPAPSVAALRSERLLSVLVPIEAGGEARSLTEVAGVARTLGAACASTGMIFAMHQIQVACLARHGRGELHRRALERVAAGQLLLASATTEAGVGGDVRTSLCALEPAGEGVALAKQTPVISYGDDADAVLVTARRERDSPASDQVLVYCEPPALRLDPTGTWDTLGFRATCSRGFDLRWEGPADAVLRDPYGDISGQTMLPVSHVVWSSVWLGIAESAAAKAHGFVRAEARRTPGRTPPAATRLAELSSVLQRFRSMVARAAVRFDEASDGDAGGGMAFAASMNTLKVASSELVVEVVGRSMLICGMAGYRLDSPYCLGRNLRDAYGAALMINNDRIIANTAQLLLASKEI